jgi:methylene-tetrahydromethanopterin dehydrogenase
MKNILIYFDMDKRPSPFDVLFAYDVGFDIVLPFSAVTADEITALVQDAMFPRGPEGVKYTTLFFGGSDLDAVEEMAENAKKTLFPPFQLSIILDPKGAHTTSSALVAKVQEALNKKGETFKDKKAAVLSRILAKEDLEVTVVDVIEGVEKVAEKIQGEVGGKVKGVRATSPEEIVSVAKGCEILISTGPAGIEIIPREFLPKLEKCMVAADVNAVSPTGIGGIKPTDDTEEVEGISGIGALAIGNLRNKVAAKMLKEAMVAEKGFFNYTHAYEFAKDLSDI